MEIYMLAHGSSFSLLSGCEQGLFQLEYGLSRSGYGLAQNIIMHSKPRSNCVDGLNASQARYYFTFAAEYSSQHLAHVCMPCII